MIYTAIWNMTNALVILSLATKFIDKLEISWRTVMDTVNDLHNASLSSKIRTFVLTTTFLHSTVYPKKYAHGFVVLCVVVLMQSFIMNSHEVFIHIHQGCFAGTGAIVRLPQCQWSKPDGYGKISQCITTKKHSKVKTVCIFLGIYCTSMCPNIPVAAPHTSLVSTICGAHGARRTYTLNSTLTIAMLYTLHD